MSSTSAWASFAVVFGAVFLAELGDKTQLAALSFAAGGRNPWLVFLAASAALVVVTAMGVAVGALLSNLVPAAVVRRVAAGIFILLGVWMLWRG